MNREIKFRGISTDTVKWVIGYGVAVYEDKATIIHKQGINVMHLSDVKPATVGEYTGLKDKNGNEIYEGDILDNGTGNYKGEVVYNNGGFTHRNSPLGYYVEDGIVEDNRDDQDSKITLQEQGPECWAFVIGNIYEHPELISKEAVKA